MRPTVHDYGFSVVSPPTGKAHIDRGILVLTITQYSHHSRPTRPPAEDMAVQNPDWLRHYTQRQALSAEYQAAVQSEEGDHQGSRWGAKSCAVYFQF
jgi:hypothetical protein